MIWCRHSSNLSCKSLSCSGAGGAQGRVTRFVRRILGLAFEASVDFRAYLIPS